MNWADTKAKSTSAISIRRHKSNIRIMAYGFVKTFKTLKVWLMFKNFLDFQNVTNLFRLLITKV